MTSPAEHAATVRAHLKGNGGYLPQHEPMLALDALEAALVELTHQRSVATEWAAELAEKHRLAAARADELERKLAEQKAWIDRVSLGSTEAAGAADEAEQRAERLEAALRKIADPKEAAFPYEIARAALGEQPQ